MGLKSIEMQVALPRVLDAAKIQEQEQQRGTHIAQNMAATVEKAEEKARNRVSELEEKEKAAIKDQKSKQQKKKDEQERKKQFDAVQTVNPIVKHPFKGNRIDFTS